MSVAMNVARRGEGTEAAVGNRREAFLCCLTFFLLHGWMSEDVECAGIQLESSSLLADKAPKEPSTMDDG